MPLLFLRHAKAGDRSRWAPPDHLRPLSEKGRLQAEALVDAYAAFPVERILTSAYVRCAQTVEPLAAALALPVEETPALAEGAGWQAPFDLMRDLAGTTAVLCTHGDVMVETLDALERRTGLALPPGYACQKAGTWVLLGDDFPFAGTRYLPPPR